VAAAAAAIFFPPSLAACRYEQKNAINDDILEV